MRDKLSVAHVLVQAIKVKMMNLAKIVIGTEK